MDAPHRPEPEPIIDHAARERLQERHRALGAGLLALPNLYLRSAATLGLLYGMLTLVLITLVVCHYATPELALIIGVTFAVL